MKQRFFLSLAVVVALVAGLLPFASRPAQAATTLPTAPQVAGQIAVGWNLGNSLEAIGGETAWGNPMVTQQLIDSVKAAGFNAVRIPCAWNDHADQTTLQIDPAWLARVKQVVDYAISNGMYVVLNEHWDGGWLENNPTYAAQAAVNAKLEVYWTQIANYFINYDEHLLFAGTNETHYDYGTPTTEHITVQQSYLQTFVDAVRATGGNNATRTLVVQTYNTNMWHGLDYFTMPTDTVSNRLIVEVHYYDPYDYTLNQSGSCLYWGAPYPTQSACTWAQESYVDDLFGRVRAKWVNAGIPVIIGEYGVATRPNLDLASRQYYLKYINAAAIANGIKTFYWDNGVPPSQSNGFALFNRSTGAVIDQGALDAIMEGAVPCTDCTATPTRTPTATPTITMTPCYDCGFKLQYKAAATANSTNQITPHFNIINTNSAAVPLSEFTIRYWYTNEGGKAQEFHCDYAVLGCANVTGSFTKLTTSQPGADSYLEIAFGPAAGNIPAGGQSREIQARFNKVDWTSYTQGDDYSFDATKTGLADWDRVTLYRSGTLVWGAEPGMGPTNTPSASSTSTATATRTPTRTHTPTGVTPTATSTRTPTGVTPTSTPTRTPTAATPSATATATRTLTPSATLSPSPTGGVTCDPVDAAIAAAYTYNGPGSFCWRASDLGSYINSWNLTSLTINGVDYTNKYAFTSNLPAKVNGYWYIRYSADYAWSHFEAK